MANETTFWHEKTQILHLYRTFFWHLQCKADIFSVFDIISFYVFYYACINQHLITTKLNKPPIETYTDKSRHTHTIYCRVMRCIARPMPSCGDCLCVSVTFVHCVKTNKDIFKKIFTAGQPHHSSFSIPNRIAIFRREPPPLTGAINAGGVGRNRDSEPICLLLTLQQARCCKHGCRWMTATISQVVTIISLVVYCGYSITKCHAQ